MSVCIPSTVLKDELNAPSEFLRIRKIPLTDQAYIGQDLSAVKPPLGLDPDCTALRDQIRELVLTDRELADKVS